MKLKFFIFFLLFCFSLSINLYSIDSETVRQHLENWISSAGQQLPTSIGTMASLLSSTPSVTKWAIQKYCHKRLLEINHQLGKGNLSKKEINRLNNEENRRQAIIDAINGKPEKLIEIERRDREKRPGKPQVFPKDSLDLEKENMLQMLALYKKKINEIIEAAHKTTKKTNILYQKRNTGINELAGIANLVEHRYTDGIKHQQVLNDLCSRIEIHQKKALAYGVLIIEGEKNINQIVKNARSRAVT